MPPLNNFTTKAKEVIRRAHELAIERGQNHVNPLHLLAALVLQEESIVASILDRLDIDIILFTDSIMEAIEVKYYFDDAFSTQSDLSDAGARIYP